MYIYYILRNTQADKPVELEGDLTTELYPGVDLDDGPATITALVQKLRAEGTQEEWDECDITDSFFEREDNYIYFNDRWMRRSDAPWRKDRYN